MIDSKGKRVIICPIESVSADEEPRDHYVIPCER